MANKVTQMIRVYFLIKQKIKSVILLFLMICFLSHTNIVFAAKNEDIRNLPNEVVVSGDSSPIYIQNSKLDRSSSSDIRQNYVDHQILGKFHAFVPLAKVVIAPNAEITEEEFVELVPESESIIVNTRILAKQVNAANEKNGNKIYCKYELSEFGDYTLLVSSIDETKEKLKTNRLIIERRGKVRADDEELNSIEDKYSHREVDIAELHNAVKEVTQYYRGHDYPAATAYLPSQKSGNGDIYIGVEQGQYGAIKIDNKSKLRTSIIESLTKGFKIGDELQGKQLETAIYNINSAGGIKAAGIMKAGSSIGETDLTIKVANDKCDSYVLYSENYGSKSSGRYRYGFLANWYEMAGIGDHLSLNVLLSNRKQHNYGVRYDTIVGHSGTRIGIGISRTDYELGSQLSSLGATGLANTYSLYGVTPIFRTGTSGLSIGYGWDYRDMTDEMRTVDYIVKKHSHAFHVGINGFQKQKINTVIYNFAFYAGNLTGDRASIAGQSLKVAPEGYFNKYILNSSLTQTLSPQIDLLLRFQGQLSGTNLDSSERLYLGGANGVRAYPQGEGSGDEGYQATAELRYHTKVPGLVLSIYFDIGHVKYMHDGTIPGGITLKGWGIGISWTRENDFFVRIDYARRIGLPDSATDDAKAKQRIWFTIGKTW